MDTNFMIESFPKILAVLPMTIYISVVATFLGFIVAILIAIAREKNIRILSPVLGILVSLIRGTPVIVQIYVVYYGLPQFLMYLQNQGIDVKPQSLSHIFIALLAYGMNAAANLSETIRSAYHSVDKNQYRAAISVGMTPTRGITRIVVPQLVTNLIPNFSNFFLDLLKDTSLVYNIGIVEIMAKSNIIASFGFRYLETYFDALIIYLITCLVIGKLFQLAEVLFKKRIYA